MTRGYGQSDLSQAVQNWNTTYAGKKDARGVTIPQLVLPPSYNLGSPTDTQDIRLTKAFHL